MDKNYTPIDPDFMQKKEPGVIHDVSAFDSTLNTVILFLATITVFVLSVILFVLIQKKLNGTAFYKSALQVRYDRTRFIGS